MIRKKVRNLAIQFRHENVESKLKSQMKTPDGLHSWTPLGNWGRAAETGIIDVLSFASIWYGIIFVVKTIKYCVLRRDESYRCWMHWFKFSPLF